MPAPTSDVSISDGTVEITSGLYDTDDGIKLQVAGDTYPRLHLTPQGEIKVGAGTATPVSSGTASVVYNSSGTQSGDRYNTWSDLLARIAAEEGQVDVFLEQNETVPTGAHDLGFSRWHGNVSDPWLGGFTLTWQEGATISNWQLPWITDALAWVNVGDAMFDITDDLVVPESNTGTTKATENYFHVVLDNGALFAATDAECFTLSADSTTLSFSLLAESRLFNGSDSALSDGVYSPSFGNYEIVNVTGTGNVIAIVLDGPRTTIPSNGLIVRGVSGNTLVAVGHDASTTRQTFTNSNFAGTNVGYLSGLPSTNMTHTQAVTADWTASDGSSVATLLDEIGDRLTDVEDPGQIAYTPTTESHWADTDPANLQDAIDRLASIVYTLNSSTAIP